MKTASMDETIERGNKALEEMVRYTQLFDEARTAGNDVLAEVYAKVVVAKTQELKSCALMVLELKEAMIAAQEARASGMLN